MPKLFFRPFRFNPFAVESPAAPGAKGVVPGVGKDETDPDWQPM